MKLILAETGQRSMTQKRSNSLENNTNKRLSVQIALTGLSFLVTNDDKTEVIQFTEKRFKSPRTPEELLVVIDQFFTDEKDDSDHYNQIELIYANTEYTLVPTPLFDQTKASDYLKFNSKILLNDFIAWDELKHRDIHLVYVPYVNINNYIFEKFGSFKYYHAATVLLEVLSNESKFSDTPSAFIHVQDNSFDLVIQKMGKLLLCNSYHFVTPEDFIYYVLFCFEQLQINPDTVNTVFAGAISLEDSMYEIAYTYIRNISFFENRNNRLDIPSADDHQYILLKNVN